MVDIQVDLVECSTSGNECELCLNLDEGREVEKESRHEGWVDKSVCTVVDKSHLWSLGSRILFPCERAMESRGGAMD